MLEESVGDGVNKPGQYNTLNCLTKPLLNIHIT